MHKFSRATFVTAVAAIFVACSQTPTGSTVSQPLAEQGPPAAPNPPPGSPGYEPIPPVQQPVPVVEPPPPAEVARPSQAITVALQQVPTSVAERYVLSISGDRSKLTIDPRPQPQPVGRAARSRGFSVEDSEAGGKIISLDGGPFRNAVWVSASLRQQVAGATQQQQLLQAGYHLDQPRDLLVVDGESDPNPTVFAFSADVAKPGIVGVCSDVTIIDFTTPAPSRPIAVRKPVVYLYPQTTQRVRVGLTVDGEWIASYPALTADAWTVVASPDGQLVDVATGRRHRYLFWEATSAEWHVDPTNAHCVAGTEATAFLERACAAYALTSDECGDFVSYWLPTLANNPYSVVEFIDEDRYGRYAQLAVEPAPDTVIRPFMVFRRSEVPVAVGAPAWPQRQRRGFTVVEWGGADLDAKISVVAR